MSRCGCGYNHAGVLVRACPKHAREFRQAKKASGKKKGSTVAGVAAVGKSLLAGKGAK